ncbi:hypothetical protein ACP70R_018914 [Stipagrostis hirtigluma subsp. patula]
MSSSAPASSGGWADLLRDVLWDVFLRLERRDVLAGAGLACAAWWRFAREEPELWRRINLSYLTEPDGSDGDDDCYGYSIGDSVFDKDAHQKSDDNKRWKAMARAAVARSAGQCEAFWGPADEDFLVKAAPSLIVLYVAFHGKLSLQVFTELIQSFTLLEVLQLEFKSDACNDDDDDMTERGEPSTSSWAELFQATCKACNHLYCFVARHSGGKACAHYSDSDCGRGTTDQVVRAVDGRRDLLSVMISRVPDQNLWDLWLRRFRLPDEDLSSSDGDDINGLIF